APGIIGERLDELVLARADGMEIFFEAVNVRFVGGGIVGGEEHGAAGESGFDRVEGGFGLACRSGRSGGQLGILSISIDLGLRGRGAHKLPERSMRRGENELSTCGKVA
ncbi:MAG: hypothetical protein ACRDHZ_15235, partial [Ktedonobacteraceae bacterium]